MNARREVAVALAEPSRRDRGELYEDFVRMQGAIETMIAPLRTNGKWSKGKAMHCRPGTVFGYKSDDDASLPAALDRRGTRGRELFIVRDANGPALRSTSILRTSRNGKCP